MTEKELRKLSRAELLEMLLKQSREMEYLKTALQQTEEKLHNRGLMLEEAGSIAEAALRVNHVFETAQQAADQYLESIKKQNAELEGRCLSMEQETSAKCAQMERETSSKCAYMIQEAQQQANAYWEDARKKLEQFVDQQADLKSIIMDLAKYTKQ